MSPLARSLADALRSRPWAATARPAQLPPAGTWLTWLLLGGRGSGKTRAASEFVTREIMAGRARHVAVVGRTAADVRDVMVEGAQSGLLAVAPDWFRPVYEPSKRRLTWPNGAVATAYSADEPDLLRGPQHDLAWCDEWAAWDRLEEAATNLRMGLRIGPAPRTVISTTPRPIPLVRALVAREGKDVAVSRMTTFENLANLSPQFAESVMQYAGTRIGRQELYAEIVEDVEGALWTRDVLEKSRLRDSDTVPDLARIVVGVDPALTASEGAETGIVVVGVALESASAPQRYFVLADCSRRGTPHAWALAVAGAYHRYQADRIVAERNAGGDMVEAIIRTVDRDAPVTVVHVSRGKVTRAEPVAALYERGLVHHAGVFTELEDQMATFVPGEPSPDRLDALVHAVTALVESGAPAGSSGWTGNTSLWRPDRWSGGYED